MGPAIDIYVRVRTQAENGEFRQTVLARSHYESGVVGSTRVGHKFDRKYEVDQLQYIRVRGAYGSRSGVDISLPPTFRVEFMHTLSNRGMHDIDGGPRASE